MKKLENILKENMRRFRTKNLSEQGLTPAPAPTFDPGELTDPGFRAPKEIEPLSDNAKRRRYNDFIKKQEKEFEDDLEKMHNKYVKAGDDRFLRWLKDMGNITKYGTFTMPKNYLEYVAEEFARGNYPKTLKELFDTIDNGAIKNISKAIAKAKSND